jgi:hypothetical protein
MFKNHIYDREEFKTNLNGSVQAHRVSRIPGGDFRYLNPMVIWPRSTHRSNWTTYSTPGWHYACSESGYTDSQISFEWLTCVFDPQTKARANGKPRLLICDGFGTHETLEILEHCFANNIRLCRLPSHTSHKLQPCDVAVFAPLKTAYRDAVERLERGGVNTIGKQHFTSLYSSARKAAFTQRNIRAGWSKCGLTPLNPQRVLKNMEKPLTESSEAAGDLAAGDLTLVPRGLQHETPALPVVPVTPVTPVTAEAFASLRDMILERDAHAMHDAERQNLKRHLDKLTRTAQTSIAEGALLQEDNRFVRKMNNEAKVRRSTKSLVKCILPYRISGCGEKLNLISTCCGLFCAVSALKHRRLRSYSTEDIESDLPM